MESPRARFGLGIWMWKIGLEIRCLLLGFGESRSMGWEGGQFLECYHPVLTLWLQMLEKAGTVTENRDFHALCGSCWSAKWTTRSPLRCQPRGRTSSLKPRVFIFPVLFEIDKGTGAKPPPWVRGRSGDFLEQLGPGNNIPREPSSYVWFLNLFSAYKGTTSLIKVYARSQKSVPMCILSLKESSPRLPKFEWSCPSVANDPQMWYFY